MPMKQDILNFPSNNEQNKTLQYFVIQFDLRPLIDEQNKKWDMYIVGKGYVFYKYK